MEALERPFADAIAAAQIEGAILEGRSKNGKSYSKAFGTRTLLDSTQQPQASSDMLFLASATKLLTAIAVLQCCDRGLLSLDKDLRPEFFSSHKVLTSYDEGSEPIYEDVKNRLTFRHLLTHSSGLAYDFLSPSVQRWVENNPVPKEDPAKLSVPTRYHQPLAFQPGENWLYGVGLDWAGHIVECTTGMKLDVYFRTHILAPLNIAPTELSFFPIAEGLSDRMVDLNPKDPLGEGLSVGNGMRFQIPGDGTCYGGQGAYATGPAYVEILHSLLLNDSRLLPPAVVAEMLTPQLEAGAKAGFEAVLTTPLGGLVGMGTNSANRNYGLSGLLITEDGDKSGMGPDSMSWGGGINSNWVLDPANGVCGFVAPQLGIPANIGKSMELRGAFKLGLKGVLEEGS